jgi:hypothetical protein
VSCFWTTSAPYERLSAECLAVLEGESDPDAYLLGLVHLAWDGLTHAVDRHAASEVRLGSPLATEAAPVLAAEDSGLITVGMPRLRELSGQSLQCAKQYLARYREMCFLPQHPLREVTELDCFETRLLGLLGAAASIPDTHEVVSAIARGMVRTFAGEPSAPSPALLATIGAAERTQANSTPDWMFEEDHDWDYLARVHHHLILNALMFALCHEGRHIALGHLDMTAEPTLAQSRKGEIDADAEALNACAVTKAVDLRAAFRIFRLMHDADPAPAGAALTHPHSTDRLLLLGAATQKTHTVTDPVLRDEVNALLRALRTPAGCMTESQSATADLYLASDLDGAFVEAEVRETFLGRPSMEEYDRQPKLWVDAQATFIDPASSSVLTSADVVIHLHDIAGNFGSTQIDTTETGFRLTKLVNQHVRTPPSWRLQWPHGRLELRELRNFRALVDHPAHFSARSTEFTAENIIKRHVLWNLPTESILGSVTEDTAHQAADVPMLLEVAKWCDDYDCPEDAMRLRISAVDHEAAAVPTTTARDLLEQLMDIGRANHSADESRATSSSLNPSRLKLLRALVRFRYCSRYPRPTARACSTSALSTTLCSGARNAAGPINSRAVAVCSGVVRYGWAPALRRADSLSTCGPTAARTRRLLGTPYSSSLSR